MSATMIETRDAPGKRASTRFSTYSATPTLAPSVAPSRVSVAYSEQKRSFDLSAYKPAGPGANMPRNRASYAAPSNRISARDISVDEAGMIKMAGHLQRLEDKRLQQQRYVVSEGKREELGSLALGAKLEKALGRRLSAQDAVFTKKKVETKK